VKIVFRYHKEPTNNFLGTDGSSDAITLFDTGIVRYEHYLFRCAEPFKTKDFGPFEELVTIVQSIIDEYKQNGNVKQDKEALGIEDKKTLINVNEVFDNESQIINPVEEENIELSKVNILD
jgi:hypothetical protein